MSMKDEAIEIGASAVETGVSAAGEVISAGMECTCTGAKVVVGAVTHIGGGILGGVVRILGSFL